MKKKPMTKHQAFQLFRSIDQSPPGDKPWRRESWNNFTDSLCKEGLITTRQYETWTYPF